MISVIIPAYNEEETIAKVVNEINTVMSRMKIKHEIIVVNDSSTDKTSTVARKSGAVVIDQIRNKGYGYSLKTGIRNAKYEWILITDADGTYSAKEIPKLLKKRNEYSLVVGARTGKNVSIPIFRKPAKWILRRIANYLSGFSIPDLNSGLRLFRKSDIIKYFNILPSGFSFTTTQTLAYLSSDHDVAYVPIDYLSRKGKSKIRPIRDGMNFILLIIRTMTLFKPLKIFIPVSAALFLFGLVFLTYQVIFLNNVTELPVLFMLSALQIAFLGVLADINIIESKK